jgi:pimeloyl-ACP methyl ester carboxylesterase
MALTPSLPRRRSLRSLSPHGFHRVVWHEWGDPECSRVVVCVHGLARNGRDFDVVGEALAPTHRVLAVDMPGRGESEWLRDPGDYTYPTYLTTLTALIAASGAESVDWIGTSMGGLLGMILASQPGTPIVRLVVNDIGPVIGAEALARIGSYVGEDVSFESVQELERYVRRISAPFGALTDAQWAHVAGTNARQRADGRWVPGYDPRIAIAFRNAPAPPDLWPVFDAIACPTLVLRGRESDLLSAETAAAMAGRGPKPRVVTFDGVGHAPMLLAPEQVATVVDFLA